MRVCTRAVCGGERVCVYVCTCVSVIGACVYMCVCVCVCVCPRPTKLMDQVADVKQEGHHP